MVKANAKTGKEVFVRTTAITGGRAKGVSLFKGVNDPETVTQLFSKSGSKSRECTLRDVAKVSEGLVASIECQPTALEKAMVKIVNETNSRVWARGLRNKGIEIIVQNPWGADISEKVSIILKKGGLSLKEDPYVTTQGVDEDFPLLDSSKTMPKIDDLDKDIARTLLINGYYETPRPDGITQERLAKELQISKPILEKRMRKIQGIGIRNLLEHQEFTKGEIKAGWETLQEINSRS